ncbi:MAG: hypothetical protein ACSHX6_03440 [Akkermansiaceae bacterium]
MKTIIKLVTGALIAIAFSSCQSMPSGNDNVIPPVHNPDHGPMIVC